MEVETSTTRLTIESSFNNSIYETLSRLVIGQESAMQGVSRLIGRSESVFRVPGKPLGSVILLGPTGVGKTETAKAIAQYYHGHDWEDFLLRVDCGAELSERHDLKSITGSPPSYVGYDAELTFDPEWVSSESRKVVLLDEIEKAHPAFFKMLLSVIDEAVLNVRYKGQPEQLDFSNCFIVATSNVGAEDMVRCQRSMGFTRGNEAADTAHAALSGLQRFFSYMPEFPARFDEILTFNNLTSDHLYKILDKFTGEMNHHLLSRGVPIVGICQEIREYLVTEAMKDTTNGARGLRRLLNREVYIRVADLMAYEQFEPTDVIVLGLEEGVFTYYKVSNGGDSEPEPREYVERGARSYDGAADEAM